MPRKIHANALYHTAMRKLEIDLIRWYLRNSGWSYTKMAEALGVPRNFIYRRMRILGLEPTVEAQREKPEPELGAQPGDDPEPEPETEQDGSDVESIDDSINDSKAVFVEPDENQALESVNDD